MSHLRYPDAIAGLDLDRSERYLELLPPLSTEGLVKLALIALCRAAADCPRGEITLRRRFDDNAVALAAFVADLQRDTAFEARLGTSATSCPEDQETGGPRTLSPEPSRQQKGAHVGCAPFSGGKVRGSSSAGARRP